MVARSKSLKTWNFQGCPKPKRLHFHQWGLFISQPNPNPLSPSLFFFGNQKMQLEVVCNFTELDFSKSNIIHGFSGGL
jgi:hypothetical protein